MKDKDLETVFFMDNCIFLNTNVTELKLDMDKPHYCIPDNTKKPYRWSASLHSALVNIDFLGNFIAFCNEYYQDETKFKTFMNYIRNNFRKT